ncbi:MAG: helix-turn-helix domain-containing protein [Bryobacterales bacterium]|nr:helix-turn-helix domain-containing protein [Bryobacterales bacterium]
MDEKVEQIALFRYELIAPLVLGTLSHGELTRRAQQIAARLYDFPHTQRRQVSVDTLLEWTLRYRRHGLEGLKPKPRQDRGQMRVITPETAALIEQLKREKSARTGTALLTQLSLEVKGGDQLFTSYRPPRCTASCAPMVSPSVNWCGRKRPPTRTKGSKRSMPIRSGNLT